MEVKPLLLGVQKLEKLFKGLRENLQFQKHPIGIQTNGILINHEILELCTNYHVSISVSIDGGKEVNDLSRRYKNGKSSFAKTLLGISKLKDHKNSDFLFSGTLTVIQPESDPVSVYNFLKSIGTPNMDFLYQDGNHDKLPYGKASFDSHEYGSWLAQLFYTYLNDKEPVPIRILDDYIRVLIGGNSIKEGVGEHEYGILVIETDGEIRKNDTLRASFEGVDFFEHRPNVLTHKLESIINSDEYKSYVKSSVPISSI